ncbi:MAG TPA: hypothetical protein VGE23_00420 [Candidatus Paceibacterota bacterium]
MKMHFESKNLLARFSYGTRIHPTRDWFLLLSLATALIVASVAWNLWLLKSVERGGVIGSEQAPATFDAAPIESARAVFEARRGEELRYRQEYRFVDPSR